jgi:hypothetical protein
VTLSAPGAEPAARLGELSRRLEEAAARLRADGVEPEEAKQLAGECAELAADAAVELDRLARGDAQDRAGDDHLGKAAPGQEELL